MNAVLARVLETQTVSDDEGAYPLRHPQFPNLPVAIDPRDGAILQRIVRDVRPRTSLEIGCAYGISTLYICDALAQLGQSVRHIVIDPFQSTQWRGIGLRNVHAAGFDHMVDFRCNYSEFVLPELARQHVAVDFAFVDGRHTFDQVMVELYYLNRLLRVGGVIVFDDADRPSVNRVVRHALTYPAYEVYRTSDESPRQGTMASRLRRRIARLPLAESVVRSDVLHRDWDLGISGSCVAIRKIEEDKRPSGWDRPF